MFFSKIIFIYLPFITEGQSEVQLPVILPNSKQRKNKWMVGTDSLDPSLLANLSKNS
jgi:hypothetical protein